VSKIQLVADHVGTTYAGPSGDYRVLLKAARKNAMEFGLSYGTPILMSNLTRTTAQTVQNYTVGGGVRYPNFSQEFALRRGIFLLPVGFGVLSGVSENFVV
jgi:20S proteasome alpha/beta subunit